MNQASDFPVHTAAENKWSCLSADMHEPGVRLPVHFFPVHMNQASDLPVHAAAEKQMELPFGSPIYRISNMTV